MALIMSMSSPHDTLILSAHAVRAGIEQRKDGDVWLGLDTPLPPVCFDCGRCDVHLVSLSIRETWNAPLPVCRRCFLLRTVDGLSILGVFLPPLSIVVVACCFIRLNTAGVAMSVLLGLASVVTIAIGSICGLALYRWPAIRGGASLVDHGTESVVIRDMHKDAFLRIAQALTPEARP
jgi:hypothetical protein